MRVCLQVAAYGLMCASVGCGVDVGAGHLIYVYVCAPNPFPFPLSPNRCLVLILLTKCGVVVGVFGLGPKGRGLDSLHLVGGTLWVWTWIPQCASWWLGVS